MKKQEEKMSQKKREILPLLNSAIMDLTAMSADASKLEYYNNDQASKRLKRAITDFKNGSLKKLQDTVFDIRNDVKVNSNNKRYRKSVVKKGESVQEFYGTGKPEGVDEHVGPVVVEALPGTSGVLTPPFNLES